MTSQPIIPPQRKAPPVFIITGPPQGGKTTCLQSILPHLRQQGVRIHGIIAHGLMNDCIRTGFILEDLATGKRYPLSSSTPIPEAIQWKRFFFQPEGLRAGFSALAFQGKPGFDLTIVDEVGPFEIGGGVWAPCLDQMVWEMPRPLLWIVRKSLLREVISRWQLNDPEVFEIPVPDPEAVAERITMRIKEWNEGISPE